MELTFALLVQHCSMSSEKGEGVWETFGNGYQKIRSA